VFKKTDIFLIAYQEKGFFLTSDYG